MVVVSTECLPLGFRFHPTDEELVNHYLKGKITGRKVHVEVIPEIDVCKCEPWDLPGKSLIRTVDPEWFFFAPRDRKYPNGHRSNRATEAGYWKATGKDRTIKTRTSAGNVVIGMKKTLVFYRGRAPKGERTGWIMHEYRTVESDVEGASGDQGAYVLCRLFSKHLEKASNSNSDDLDEGGSSPTLSKSSVWNTECNLHDELNCEVYLPKSDDSNSPSNITLDAADHDVLSEKPEDSDAFNISFKNNYEPSQLGEVERSRLTKSAKVETNVAKSTEISSDKAMSTVDAERDDIDEFLDSVLCDPSPCYEELNAHKNSTANTMPEPLYQIYGSEAGPLWDVTLDESCGTICEENYGLGLLQMENAGTYVGNSVSLSNSLNSPRCSAYGHYPDLRSDGSDDFSAPWPLFDDIQNSSTNLIPDDIQNSATNMIPDDGYDGNTGINVRFRHPQVYRPSILNQGKATRRLRLQQIPQFLQKKEDTEVEAPKEEHAVNSDKIGNPREEKLPHTTDSAKESKSLLLRQRKPYKDTIEHPRPRSQGKKPQLARFGSALLYVAVGAICFIFPIMLISRYV